MEPLGYQFLVEQFDLSVPELYKKSFLSATAKQSKEVYSTGEEEYFPSRFNKVARTWQDQLLFALKNEGVNLAVLNALFRKLSDKELIRFILDEPTGKYRRRVWFFYEFFSQRELPIQALNQGNYIAALEPDEYFTTEASVNRPEKRARRQRVINNLIGNSVFCPIVRRTKKLKEFQAIDLTARIKQIESDYPSHLVAKATKYLCMKETKSSFAIERLTPNQRRMARFVELLKRKCDVSLTKDFLIRIQNDIVDERYRNNDYRKSQVYVGESLTPMDERIHYIAPKPEDIGYLMKSYLEMADDLLKTDSDPVLSAALISFAFVFLHPFDDGNGRLHRYLLHYVLSRRRFISEGMIFPFSSQFHSDPASYDRMLESVSEHLMSLIEYRLDSQGRMTVENETADYYRFLNMTEIAESFYQTILKVIDEDFSKELKYLYANELAKKELPAVVDLPDERLRSFIQLVRQNNGLFPSRRRKLFAELTDKEIVELTHIVKKRLCDFNIDSDEP